jgi:hypothetical protein
LMAFTATFPPSAVHYVHKQALNNVSAYKPLTTLSLPIWCPTASCTSRYIISGNTMSV